MRKPVVGFEGFYEVDDCGNVYSLPRMRRANYGDYMKPEIRPGMEAPLMAWCAQNGVELRDARQWVDPDTGEIMGEVLCQ